MADQQLTRSDQIERKIDKATTGGMMAVAPGGAGRFVPQDMNQALEFAKLMAISGKAVRKHLRDQPGTCLAVAMQATEWQMNPFAVANKTYEVNDQLAFEAQLVNAVINTRAPLQKRLRVTYEGTGNALICKVSGLLIGEDEPFEYESPPFANITPKNSPVWTTDPRRQIAYYSTRNWARLHCPEIILGVVTDDEMEDARRAANARDITPNPDQLPPPRPTAETMDNRGDQDEHARIKAEVEADLPKDFVIVSHTGASTQAMGPRAFIADMWQLIEENKKTLSGIEFDTFANNNADCITLLNDHNFGDAAHDLVDDIASHLNRLTAAPPPPEPPAAVAPQVDQQDVPAGAEIQGTGEVIDQEPEHVAEAEKQAPTDQEAAPNDPEDTEPDSSGVGAETSSAGAGSKTPPAEFTYKDTTGRSRYFGDPKAWGTFVLKGVNHPKVTVDILDKVAFANKELFEEMKAWGGDYAAQAKIVLDAFEKRKKELK